MIDLTIGSYNRLHKAQLTFDYLHTNSTTHEFIFGAIAELIDNARDAKSNKLEMFTEKHSGIRGGLTLNFLDDGCGMSSEEVTDIVSFGKSMKRSSADEELIGQYGNGLKSSSMRIGNDMILFTKQYKQLTCLMLSRTFHECEGIEEVVVPIPVFQLGSMKPVLNGGKTVAMHNIELEVIFKYSPFKTFQQMIEQFNRINSDTGTLVVIFNLRLMESGKTEIDVTSDPFDILLTNEDTNEAHNDLVLYPERHSLRHYVSILYFNPRMRVYIQGRKVFNSQLIHALMRPREYTFVSTRFKAKTEKALESFSLILSQLEERAMETESKLMDRQQKGITDLGIQREISLLQSQLLNQRHALDRKRCEFEAKQRSLKTPKTLTFTFGINVHNRRRDGVFIYNCNRLIRMYERDGKCVPGIVGVVNIPSDVMEPTHNKQGFADNVEYRFLLRNIFQMMQIYKADTKYRGKDESELWLRCGYPADKDWTKCLAPSSDPKCVRKRHFGINLLTQCDRCLKWRVRAFDNTDMSALDHWECAMNPDPEQSACRIPEKIPSIPKGVVPKNFGLKKTKREIEEPGEDLVTPKKTVRFDDSEPVIDVEVLGVGAATKTSSRWFSSPTQKIVTRSILKKKPTVDSIMSEISDSSEGINEVRPQRKVKKTVKKTSFEDDRDYRPPVVKPKTQKDLLSRLRETLLVYLRVFVNENSTLTAERFEDMTVDELIELDMNEIIRGHKKEVADMLNRQMDERNQAMIESKEAELKLEKLRCAAMKSGANYEGKLF